MFMYLTKDKIIYKPNEHLTVFPKTTEEVPGYTLLKTEGKDFKYGINNVPVYRMRSEKIENKEVVSRVACYIKTEYTYSKLQELYTQVIYQYVINLYEIVKVFPSKKHRIALVNYLKLKNGMIINAPDGYLFCSKFLKTKIESIELDFTKPFPVIIKKNDYFQFQNEVPVICEKAVGEMNYGTLGTPLEKEDVLNLTLWKGKKL